MKVGQAWWPRFVIHHLGDALVRISIAMKQHDYGNLIKENHLRDWLKVQRFSPLSPRWDRVVFRQQCWESDILISRQEEVICLTWYNLNTEDLKTQPPPWLTFSKATLTLTRPQLPLMALPLRNTFFQTTTGDKFRMIIVILGPA